MTKHPSLVALLVALCNIGGAFAVETGGTEKEKKHGGDGCPAETGVMGSPFGVVVWSIVLFYVFYAFHLVCDE